MAVKTSNNATTTLAVGISNAQTVTEIQLVDGTTFPGDFLLASADKMYLTLAAGSLTEIFEVTNWDQVDSTQANRGIATVVRSGNATLRHAFAAGTVVELRMTSEVLENSTQGLNSDSDDNLSVDKNITVDGNLAVTGSSTFGTLSGITIDNLKIGGASTTSSIVSVASNSDIDIAPEGIGKVNIPHLKVDGIEIDGSVIFGNIADGDISLTPNGTGNVVVTKDLAVSGNTVLTGTLGVNGNVTLGNDITDTVTIAGDLTVNGATTTISTTNLSIQDKLIEIAVLDPTVVKDSTEYNDSGIFIDSNSATDPSILWKTTGTTGEGRWTFSDEVDVPALEVGGATTNFTADADGNIDADGTAAIGGVLTVGGTTTNFTADTDGNIDADGTAAIGGVLTVGGTTTNFTADTDGNIDADGTAAIGGVLTVGGITTNFTADADGNIDADGNLQVGGNTSLEGNVTLGNAGTDSITIVGEVVDGASTPTPGTSGQVFVSQGADAAPQWQAPSTLTGSSVIVKNDDAALTTGADTLDFGQGITASGTGTEKEIVVATGGVRGADANNGTEREINQGTVGTLELRDAAVTLAKMAGIVRGSVIVGDASGDPAVVNGTSGQVLTTNASEDAVWATPATVEIPVKNDDTLLTTSATTLDFGQGITASGTGTEKEIVVAAGGVRGADANNGTEREIDQGTVGTLELRDDAVTLAKMAEMATDSFLGRDTAGIGNPEVISAADARTILNVADNAGANVATNLAESTTTNTTVLITSSTGTDATLAAASTSRAGLLTKAGFDAIAANTLKATNVTTNLSEGTTTTTTVNVNSSDGTNATLAAASTSRAGLLTKAGFDAIATNSGKTTNVTTNLSEGTTTTTTVNVNSSDGTNATLAAASTSRAGLLTKDGFDAIATNSGKTTNATHTGEVTGATALTIASDIVDEDNLKVSNAASDGSFLQYKDGTDQLTWASVPAPASATTTMEGLVTLTGAFPSGTVMVFYQAAAPTGWAKVTTQNDKALRVVSGSGGGSGGTHAFTIPPSTSHGHTWTGNNVTSSSAGSHGHTFTGNSATTSNTGSHSHGHSLSAGNHTLTTAQMPSHTHSLTRTPEGGGGNGLQRSNQAGTAYSTGATGGGSFHSHSLSGSITNNGDHTHTVSSSGSNASDGAHTHTTTATGTNSNTGPTAFAPKYIDVIICSKN